MDLAPMPIPANARCPSCGTADVYGVQMDGRKLAGCSDCKAIWEPLPADAPPDIGTKPQPFRKSCDNCAFHRNSPERSDPEKWADLTMSMALQEKPFYCHKGVPLQVEGDDWPTDHGFKYPLTDDGLPDTGRLRLCAGFIAWWADMCSTEPAPGM